MQQQLETLLDIAVHAAEQASLAILDIYNSDEGDFSLKSDNSPLTKADKASHDRIVNILAETNLPILSEEGKSIPFDTRKDWEYYWLIDPLDGTKEFLKRNGEFTVNIALIHKGESILGVVLAPVLNNLYWGIKGIGAFMKANGSSTIELNINPEVAVKNIVASRSHLSDETKEYVLQFPEADMVSMGSSLKFMLVAEGKAQLYPRFAPTMEWDTAAAQAIVEAAGGFVITYPDLKQMRYNREDMLNGWFICSNKV